MVAVQQSRREIMTPADFPRSENSATLLDADAGAAPRPTGSARDELTQDVAKTSGNVLSILLVEDNPADARLIREMLAQAEGVRFEIAYADRLSPALDYLRKGGIDAVLLDLSLPDSRGVGTFTK